MTALGVDTSNYATSLAVVDRRSLEVVCAKKRLLPVKEGELGLRQSDAVFHHTVALPALLEEMLQEGVDFRPVGAVGVSEKPRPVEGSYMPCFLAGTAFTAALAAPLGLRPAVTTHQQGHIAAARYGAGLWRTAGETLLFHISGGTTELLKTRQETVLERVGESRDLYAGQAVDRLGVQLGYSFPAGPSVTQLALECEEEISPKVSVQGTNCHLSGLQNQCEALLEQGKAPAYVAKYCLLAVAETLLAMAEAARTMHGELPVVFAGGVMSSSLIRKYIEQRLEKALFVEPQFAGDNAIGVALIAAQEGHDA